METLAQITAFIDTNIRNFLPLVRKVNHANTHQKITNQLFPDSVVVEWDGDSQVSGLPNVECNASLTTTAKCIFKIYFTKHGNRVFYKGVIQNTETVITIGNFLLATFETSLYNPLTEYNSCSNLIGVNAITPATLPNCFIIMKDNEVKLVGTIPVGISTYQFEGSYKVTN